MIICFNDKIKSFQQNNLKTFNFLQDDIQNLMPSCEDISCKCPICKAKNNFAFHGSYIRNISFIREGKIFDFKVCVTRVICNSCGSTHALLPDFIVPYKIFSRDSILFVVSSSISSSVIKTAESLKLSWQLVYSFLATFFFFFYYVDSLNKDKKIFKTFNRTYFAINSITLCDEKFNLLFFNHYYWIFLMTKFQNNSSPPLTIGVNFISST